MAAEATCLLSGLKISFPVPGDYSSMGLSDLEFLLNSFGSAKTKKPKFSLLPWIY